MNPFEPKTGGYCQKHQIPYGGPICPECLKDGSAEACQIKGLMPLCHGVNAAIRAQTGVTITEQMDQYRQICVGVGTTPEKALAKYAGPQVVVVMKKKP